MGYLKINLGENLAIIICCIPPPGQAIKPSPEPWNGNERKINGRECTLEKYERKMKENEDKLKDNERNMTGNACKMKGT